MNCTDYRPSHNCILLQHLHRKCCLVRKQKQKDFFYPCDLFVWPDLIQNEYQNLSPSYCYFFFNFDILIVSWCNSSPASAQKQGQTPHQHLHHNRSASHSLTQTSWLTIDQWFTINTLHPDSLIANFEGMMPQRLQQKGFEGIMPLADNSRASRKHPFIWIKRFPSIA